MSYTTDINDYTNDLVEDYYANLSDAELIANPHFLEGRVLCQERIAIAKERNALIDADLEEYSAEEIDNMFGPLPEGFETWEWEN